MPPWLTNTARCLLNPPNRSDATQSRSGEGNHTEAVHISPACLPSLPLMRTALRLGLMVVSILLAACGTADPATGSTSADSSAEPFGADAAGFAASSNLAVGTERMLVAITNDSGQRLPSPDIPITLEIWLDGRDFQRQIVDGTFMWAIPDVSGLYRGTVQFDTPGTWYVSVTPEGGAPLAAFPVTVYEEPFTPTAGDPAPRSETLTSADAPISEISSDFNPNPAFYEMSVAEAVTSGRPSVIAFATPRFCTTAICQPTLVLLRDLSPGYPEVNFLHVEVFTNINDPDNIVLAPAVDEWGLPTEPWVFVVDAEGIIMGRFEGLVTPEELAALLG